MSNFIGDFRPISQLNITFEYYDVEDKSIFIQINLCVFVLYSFCFFFPPHKKCLSHAFLWRQIVGTQRYQQFAFNCFSLKELSRFVIWELHVLILVVIVIWFK